MAPSHEMLNLPNPWAAVGRDTEAGRALFALYNGFGQARSRGNDYSNINKMKTLKYIAQHGVPEFPVPKPPPPKKPEVKVPHFPQKNNHYDEFHPVDFIPRRRRASDILQQIKNDSYVVEMPPMPKGPLLDEAEKARLQEVFYWSNRNLGPDPPAEEPARRMPKKGSIEEQELLLDTIAKEIQEREAFLNEMEEYGKGDQYRNQIMFEIQQRVGQMKLLHENITKQEKEEIEKQCKITAGAQEVSYTPPQASSARGQGRNTSSARFTNTASTPPPNNRFETCSNSSASCSRATTSRAEITPGYRSAIAPQYTEPPTRKNTPECSTPNVIRTANSCSNITPRNAGATTSTVAISESLPPTPPPTGAVPSSGASAPKKNPLALNLSNSRLYSAGGSSAYNSVSPMDRLPGLPQV